MIGDLSGSVFADAVCVQDGFQAPFLRDAALV
jgi:hypothetical protein